ncbi:PilW family protein [Methyloglobulus sp.]|uniref:PilW family protein n=1 Tax=Methyloglobulus sp. TaxID=2518622 RepID=UPI003988F46D
MSRIYTAKSQQGFSLIEILIAMLIGLFLLGGLLQIFTGAKQSNRMQENLSRLQENGRFAMNFITRDIRLAGFWGCLNPSVPDVDIAGADNNAANGDNIDNGTDTLTLRGAFSQALEDPPGTPAVCGTAVNTAAAYYADPSSTITYRINNGVLEKDAVALIEGIENMQVLYGEDTDNDATANRYVPVNNVANRANVVSIRISLLVRSIDDNLTSQRITVPLYNGAPFIPAAATDRRIRRVFTSTIAVRNRLP